MSIIGVITLQLVTFLSDAIRFFLCDGCFVIEKNSHISSSQQECGNVKAAEENSSPPINSNNELLHYTEV